jgi:predicted acetyltransferase
MFSLFGKQLIKGKKVDLKIVRESQPHPFNDYAYTVQYAVYLHGRKEKIGECDLRVGMNRQLYYAGNIGYRIYREYRGHSYAYEACLLMLDQASKEYGMKEVIVTCSPENIASEKTIRKLGGVLIAETDVPADHWLYKRGETVKKIFRITL